MKNSFFRAFFGVIALSLTAFSSAKAADIVAAQSVVFKLNITFYTQQMHTNTAHSSVDYKIAETTLDTADLLKIMAEDLGVTNNGAAGFPKDSYFALSDGIYVQSPAGQTWNVSAYLQYSSTNVVLSRGTATLYSITPDNLELAAPEQSSVTYISLAHVHFEDAKHLADFTGFTSTRDGTLATAGKMNMPSAPGSGSLNGLPALIAGEAEFTAMPLTVK